MISSCHRWFHRPSFLGPRLGHDSSTAISYAGTLIQEAWKCFDHGAMCKDLNFWVVNYLLFVFASLPAQARA